MLTQTETGREFEQYAETGTAFIETLGSGLGTAHNPKRTLRILQRVFMGLRCHLPFHESINTIEVLPMAIRGLYVEGWELRNNSPRLTTVDDFVQEVRGSTGGKDFSHTEEVITAALAVIETIAAYAFPDEDGHGIDRLPRGLVNLYRTLLRISTRTGYSYKRVQQRLTR